MGILEKIGKTIYPFLKDLVIAEAKTVITDAASSIQVNTPSLQLLIQAPEGVSVKKQTTYSACYDISYFGEDTEIAPNEQKLLNTGIRFILLEYGRVSKNYCLKLYVRSGISVKQNLILQNGTGIIDSDYRNEIKVCLRNLGTTPVQIKNGDRIAQFAIERVENANVSYLSSDEFMEESVKAARIEKDSEGEGYVERTGGFGSTGTTGTKQSILGMSDASVIADIENLRNRK